MHFRSSASSALALLALAGASRAQAVTRLTITEILLDPLGPNPGAQIVEVENTGNTVADLRGWQVLAEPDAAALPALQIPTGAIVRLHLGASGTTTPADIFLPRLRELGRSETIAIYRSASFADPTEMIDFVSIGGGTGRITEAVAAGQWPSATATVAPPAAEGSTLAHYGDHAWTGRDEPGAWYDDTTPTLGRRNDPGSAFNLAEGCPGRPALPAIGLARPQTRPWTGERWLLDLFNLPGTPGTAVLIFGARHLRPPVRLEPFGLPGCLLQVGAEVLVPVPFRDDSTQWTAPIPRDPVIAGAVLYVQALVPDPAAGNPARALMTNALVLTIGSR